MYIYIYYTYVIHICLHIYPGSLVVIVGRILIWDISVCGFELAMRFYLRTKGQAHPKGRGTPTTWWGTGTRLHWVRCRCCETNPD